MHRRIYLIGFMGAGKTSVGEALADRLGWSFKDLDRDIEIWAGESIEEIFRKRGERVFRRMEAERLRLMAGMDETVIACGGGTPASAGNMAVIRASGFSVWLDAPLEIMLRRCQGGPRRPLLARPERLAPLLEMRREFYAQADLRVDASSEGPERLAALIAARLDLLAGS